MPNTCSRCQLAFNSWFDFHEHASLGNCLPETPRAYEEVRELWGGKFVKGTWTGPQDNLPADVKAKIVGKGEKRLGRKHFIGKGL